MENETNPKLKLFQSDFSDEKKFESNLEKLFQYIFLNIFPNILNLPRIDFMNSLMTSVKSILEEQYSSEIYSNEKFFSLFLSVNKIFEKKYKDYNQILSNAWDNYSNENNSYFTEFKKHCGKTQEKAMHLCNKNNKNETGNYIIVFLKNEIKFLICEKCRKSYYANLFINFCQNCKCNYYSGLISQKENAISQLATYTTPHCDSIVNEKIPCNKCKNPLLMKKFLVTNAKILFIIILKIIWLNVRMLDVFIRQDQIMEIGNVIFVILISNLILNFIIILIYYI